jgi:hypothetical protein
MYIIRPFMSQPNDHIMANTWRLIFERKQQPSGVGSPAQTVEDFSILEELLPEYRLIGFSLANSQQRRLS